eukprot:gene2607-2908_t
MVTKWLKEADKWAATVQAGRGKGTKHVKEGKFPELENGVVGYISQIDAIGGEVSDELMLEVAVKMRFELINLCKLHDLSQYISRYDNWEPTLGWVQKVKARRGLRM